MDGVGEPPIQSIHHLSDEIGLELAESVGQSCFRLSLTVCKLFHAKLHVSQRILELNGLS